MKTSDRIALEWPSARDFHQNSPAGADDQPLQTDGYANDVESGSEPHMAFNGKRQAASLAAIKLYISDHHDQQNLGVAELVAEFGLSRATIYRMFEPLGGVAKYILGLRLQRALIELGSPSNDHLRINDIAQSLGFANGPSFARAFRAHYAINPSAIRRNLRAAAAYDADQP